MKKIMFCILALSLSFSFSYAEEPAQRNKFQKAVDSQRESDLKRKNELIAKMKTLIGSYNKRLKQSGVKNANLDLPLDANKIEDIREMDRHSSKPVPSKVYAYVTDNTALFSGSDAEESVGKVLFSEKIEVIGKVEQPVLYKGHDGRWFSIRRDNGDEGWIHSSLLSKSKPSKKQSQQKENKGGELSFDVPVDGTRTSNFGSRVDPLTHKQNAFHSGIDIAAPQGTPVQAAAAGAVNIANFNKNGYGNLIVIEHEKDFTTYYGHLSAIKVAAGQHVKKGDIIGAVGTTGRSTGPHLHFEVRRGEQALDPDGFIR